MSQTKMSLHRIIAEIKAIEARLGQTPVTSFVANATGEVTPEHEKFLAESQRQYDKVASDIANLAVLKAARNLKNATVNVVIAGKTMTIDQALAYKASIPYKNALAQTLQTQLVRGQQAVDAAAARIEDKINAQLATMFSGTKKASEEEIKMIRSSVERGLKVTLLHATGLKDRVEALKTEVAAFTTEVDYVLSEANATNTVEIQLV